MATLLVRHADLVVAMDDAESQWADGAVHCVDNQIEQVGPSADLPETADRVVDARGMLVMPGLVNTTTISVRR